MSRKSKFSYEIKLKAVKQYLNGEAWCASSDFWSFQLSIKRIVSGSFIGMK